MNSLGFYLPVQRRIEAADTAELDAQIQLEQMKAMQIRQMVEEIEENKASNAPMVPAYNHFKTETEELNRIFANAYDFTFQYSEPQVDGMEIRRAMNISFTADSFDHAVSMLHEVVEGPYRCLIEDLSIQDDKDLENEAERKLLIRALNKLNSREKLIVSMRFGLDNPDGKEKTQKEVADLLGISQSYISRLEKKIMQRLKREMVRYE